MNYIILDLEATCWQDRSLNNQHEIIEIGAVKINDHCETISEFNAFVKPIVHPQLSEFCTELTTIEQSDIEQAKGFEQVITDFWTWIDLDEDYLLCSWGFYDRSQFKKDCELHGLSTAWLKPHISLKHQHAKINHLKRPIGMSWALEMEGIPQEGTHHRGIDDAKNIAKIFVKHFESWNY